LIDMFATYDKRVLNAEARLDSTASPINYRMAKEAFGNVYNKK